MGTVSLSHRLLPLSAVAESLGVSIYSVRRFVSAGAIKSVNIGSRVMVPSTEVERVLLAGLGKSRKDTRGARAATVEGSCASAV
jgi:predicted site-specific integrase-resolvase